MADDYVKARRLFERDRGGIAFRELFTPNQEGPLPPRPERGEGKGGPSINQGTAPSHSAEALAYLARTVGGNEGGNGANIATLIDGLVSDGVWAKLDALYVPAQQNQIDAILNLVGTSYTLTPTTIRVSPIFTAYIGYAFPGSSYFNVFGFTVPSPNFTQNSASFGYWAYALVDEPVPIIGNGTTASCNNLYAKYTGNIYVRVNDASAPGTPTSGTKGLCVADRSSSTASVPYVNGVALSSVASTSGAPTSGPFLIGSWEQQSSQTVCAAFIGASLGAAGQLALYNRLRTYMTAVGVP